MLTQITDPTLWSFAWLLFIFGVIVFIILLIHVKYGRELSVKLSIILIIIASVFLGFSIHFFLLCFGL